MCQGQDYVRLIAFRVKVGILSVMTTGTLGTSAAKDEGQSSPWIPTDHEFGMRLAMVRRQMGWNMKQAAAECGIAAATWRLWEDQGASPHDLIAKGRKIAQRTGCDLSWLVGLPGNRESSNGWVPLADHPRDNRPKGRAERAGTGPGVHRTPLENLATGHGIGRPIRLRTPPLDPTSRSVAGGSRP